MGGKKWVPSSGPALARGAPGPRGRGRQLIRRFDSAAEYSRNQSSRPCSLCLMNARLYQLYLIEPGGSRETMTKRIPRPAKERPGWTACQHKRRGLSCPTCFDGPNPHQRKSRASLRLPCDFFPLVRQGPSRQIYSRNTAGPDEPRHEEHKGNKPLLGAYLNIGRGCKVGFRSTRSLKLAGA